MKKSIYILAIGALAILSGCNNANPEMEIEKTEIAYTYYDYGKGTPSVLANCPSTGSPKILVIPVWFADSSTYLTSDEYKDNVHEDMATVFFGTPEETGWHSLSSFYAEESGNKLTFTGTVSDEWYQSEFTSSLVGAQAAYTMAIAIDAVGEYFASHPEDDRKSYDLDGDGFLDAVSFIYAAPDRQNLEDESLTNLWAYCSSLTGLSAPDIENPSVNKYFWASYDFMYSEENASQRTGAPYNNGGSEGFTSDNPIDAHCFIHEFGHILGLDDYYDINLQYTPAGEFSMEDQNVGGHEPFSLMALGWANPYIPTESGSITIGAFQTTREFVLLTPEWNDYDSPFDEYLILELFTPTGLNALDTQYSYKGARTKGTTETGIRLWHIDARLIEVNIGEDQTPTYGSLTSNPYPDGWKVYKAFPNTYYMEGGQNQYASILGQEYSDYNTIQLIRNDEEATYRPEEGFKGGDLFKDGDSFSMSEFSSQFVKADKLNSGKPLGWSFSVNISGEGENAKATINLLKN